ncbi:serine/threonine-protein kinase HAL4/sat4 [Hypoxylon texense]
MSTGSSPQAPSSSQGTQRGIYGHLSRTPSEFRILKILPGPDDQPVCCELQNQLLTSDVRYAAISYVWGDPRITEDIIVNNERLQVTTNLASALWHLRKYGLPKNEQTGEIQWLWADAVCINQHHIPEKNHQVSIMGTIYRGASSVLSWLGPPEPERLDRALEAIREVAPILNVTSEYFDYRLYMYDEYLMRHSDKYDYRKFLDRIGNPVEMLTAAFEKLTEKLGPLLVDVLRHVRNMMREDAPLSAAAIFAAMLAKAEDPRDMIYAVLSLVPNDITPDYDKSVHDVYVDAIGCGKELQRTLPVCLTYAGKRTENQHGLPSWLPDFSAILGRKGFLDARVGSQPIPFTVETQPPKIVGHHVLCIQGAGCGRVELVKQLDFSSDREHNVRALFQLCVDYLAEFVGVDTPPYQMATEGRRPLRELIEVLDCKKSDSRNKVSTYLGFSGPRMSSASWHFLAVCLGGETEMTDAEQEEASRRLGAPLGLGLPRSGPRTLRYEHLMVEFLETMKYSEDKTLFRTDQGQLGIGMRGLRQGDLVCDVRCDKLPILLRKLESPGPDNSRFEFVGRCYVSGLSNDEAVDLVDKGELKIETFEIQ